MNSGRHETMTRGSKGILKPILCLPAPFLLLGVVHCWGPSDQDQREDVAIKPRLGCVVKR